MVDNDQSAQESNNRPQAQAPSQEPQKAEAEPSAIPLRIVDESIVMRVKNSSHERENKGTRGQGKAEG